MKLAPQSRWWTCQSLPVNVFVSLYRNPPSHSSWQPLCFLSLKISLYFIEFYINRIIWYILIVWCLLLNIFILRSIHVVYINSLFLLIDEYYPIVYMLQFVFSFHLLMDMEVVSVWDYYKDVTNIHIKLTLKRPGRLSVHNNEIRSAMDSI